MKKIIVIIEYLFIAYIIIECNSVFSCALNNYYITEVGSFIALILAIAGAKFYNRRIKKKTIQFIFVHIIYCTIFILLCVNTSHLYGFASRFLIFFPVLLVICDTYYKNDNIKSLLKRFVDIATVLSAISLFFWLFGSILGTIKPTGTLVARWGTDYPYTSYYNLYFVRQYRRIFGISFVRNSGIYTEAPMFSLILCIALVFKLFLLTQKTDSKRGRKKYIPEIILTLGIISTISTAGYIVLAISILMLYYLKSTRSRRAKLIHLFIGFIISFAFIFAVNNLIVEKLESSEGGVRLDDFIAGINTWIEKPFIGHGYGNNESLIQNMNALRLYNTGMSNSIFTVLAQGGLYLLIFYLLPVYALFIRCLRQKKMRIICAISLFVVEFVITIFPYKFIMFFLLATMYALILNKQKNGKLISRKRN